MSFYTGDAKCARCGWRWVAVVPGEFLEQVGRLLECDRCGSLAGVLADPKTIEEEAMDGKAPASRPIRWWCWKCEREFGAFEVVHVPHIQGEGPDVRRCPICRTSVIEKPKVEDDAGTISRLEAAHQVPVVSEVVRFASTKMETSSTVKPSWPPREGLEGARPPAEERGRHDPDAPRWWSHWAVTVAIVLVLLVFSIVLAVKAGGPR